MPYLEELSLVYEQSLIVESVEKRIAWLMDRYEDWILRKLRTKIRGTDWDEEPTSTAASMYYYEHQDNPPDRDWDPNATEEEYENQRKAHLEKIDEFAKTLPKSTIEFIVNTIDPTHGKYSEWIILAILKLPLYYHHRDGDYWYEIVMSSISSQPSEDLYKITQALDVYARYNHLLDPEWKDIKKVPSIEALFDVTDKAIAAIAEKKLQDVPENESIKFDIEEGWKVIVPLTMRASIKYGLGTRWCTAAREEKHNRFNAYNGKGPLFVFVRYQSKYQYWMNVDKLEHYMSGEFEHMHDSWEQFMDELNEPVHMSKLPKEVWRSLGNVASKSDNEMIARAGKVLQSVY